MWVPAEVLRVADGTSDKASERCIKMLPAGAVLLKWPEDKDRGEKEHMSWMVLIPKKWNRPVQNGWRYDPRDVPHAATAAPSPAAERPMRC